MDPAEIARRLNAQRQKQLYLNGLEYEPEEKPMYRFEVRELQKAKDIG